VELGKDQQQNLIELEGKIDTMNHQLDLKEMQLTERDTEYEVATTEVKKAHRKVDILEDRLFEAARIRDNLVSDVASERQATSVVHEKLYKSLEEQAKELRKDKARERKDRLRNGRQNDLDKQVSSLYCS